MTHVSVISADVHGVQARVDGRIHHVGWHTLRDAASGPTYGPGGMVLAGQPDEEVRQTYAGVLDRARGLLLQEPLLAQGLKVHMYSPTSGATWRVIVTDASGAPRPGLLLQNERLDAPTRDLAFRAAREASRRLRCDLVKHPVGATPI